MANDILQFDSIDGVDRLTTHVQIKPRNKIATMLKLLTKFISVSMDWKKDYTNILGPNIHGNKIADE